MLDLKTMYDEDPVRDIIKAHFDQRDFQTAKETKDFYPDKQSPYSHYFGAIDLDCISTLLRQRWIIDVKAENRNDNRVTNFQVGLTQLIYKMRPPDLFPYHTVIYALALPGTEKYENRCRAMPLWPRQQLQVHLMLIQVDRSIKLLCPPGCTCQTAWQNAHLATHQVSEDEYDWDWLEVK